MKQISIWASKNKTYARLCIIGIYILLIILGFFIGDILNSMNVVFNSLFSLIAILISFAGLILYPSKELKRTYKNFYFRHKLADSFLILSTFLFIIYSGNSMNENKIMNFQSVNAMSSITLNSKVSENISKNSFNSSSASKKDVKKSFRKVIKQFRKKYKGLTKTEKIILIILVLFAEIFLMGILVALSCMLACSGSVALFFIVFFGGIAGIIFGTAKLIQIIQGRRSKRQYSPAQPGSFNFY